MDADALGHADATLRDRLTEVVDWVYVGPHDPRYRTTRVAEAVERLWAQLEAYRRAVHDEREFGRVMAV